jgi:hypothetical protein
MLAMPGLRTFSLAAKPGSEGVSCDAQGVFVGGVPLLQAPTAGDSLWRVRPVAELNNELTARYRIPIDIASKAGGLALIAAALNRGDLAMAAIAAVQMQLPDPPSLAKGPENPGDIARRAQELVRSGLLKFWDPTKHPRAGVPPNPGWFAPTVGDSEPVSPTAVPPDPGWVTPVNNDKSPRQVVPDITMDNPAVKPGESSPSEGEENEVGPPGIVELPLPGGWEDPPRASGPGAAPAKPSAPGVAPPRPSTVPNPVGPKTGPKPLSASGSPSTSPSGQPLPPKIGSFPVPDGLTYGTTPFGNYAHAQAARVLNNMYPDVNFIFRVGPGQRGVDVEVPDNSISVVGDQYLEIKPLTPSGERSFNEQVERWGIGPVQSLTYDSAGNLYYGFRK